ncbi:hypothetical protein BOTBODRAFT_32498 [Botryobasidium botryosum FD-172 SS1]|uniref:Aldehyde dehydrogenase domain-containing protein n=1 Tax=Botryobasidium botryosum (strain FD-172 SS1) TaxID=930990 RepID=A0A067MT32_BOTB1|nr:hypothetical protein BOTBODRAFT_32498 [Botryobasidium botryosum FD-172 SS1]
MSTVQLTLPTGRKVNQPTGLFIDNKFVPSVSGKTHETINPTTEEVICSVSVASEADIDIAVASSRKAFNTVWGRNAPASTRVHLLNRLADLLERDAQELAELEALDNGKPLQVALEGDIPDSVDCFRYYAGWADKITGQTIEIDDKGGKTAFTRHEPIGVCGQIIPWNYPIMMLAWKLAPAFAAGCTVVLKPSELTPLTALKICELTVEAGFPPGVLNCVPSLGSVGGAAISSHMDIDKVAFTGSTITGRKIMEAAAKSNLKKVTLELGGKSPHLIFESADLDLAAEHAAGGILGNMGQDCVAGSRLYVQSSIYDKFIAILAKKFKETSSGFGDPFKKETTGGPLVSKVQRDKVADFVKSGVDEGAKIVVGGTEHQGKGWYYYPTILADIRQDMKVVREEIFGPVVVVGKFDTEEEAIKLANDTSYGLGSGLQSNDANQIMRVSSALQAGTVWINQYGVLSNAAPFGGYKQSGIGRELGSYALQEYTIVKTILWDYSGKA